MKSVWFIFFGMMFVILLGKMQVIVELWSLTSILAAGFIIGMMKSSLINKPIKKRTEVILQFEIPLIGFLFAVLILR